MKVYQILLIAALALAHVSFGSDNGPWSLGDRLEVKLIDKADERHLVDTTGRTLWRMNKSEVVRQSVYNPNKSAVILRTAFQRQPVIGPGSVVRGYPYYRLIIAKKVGERVELKDALIHDSPFMAKGGKFIKELLSLSEDAKRVKAVVGESSNGGRTSYATKVIELFPADGPD